jgi:hypothetical protein
MILLFHANRNTRPLSNLCKQSLSWTILIRRIHPAISFPQSLPFPEFVKFKMQAKPVKSPFKNANHFQTYPSLCPPRQSRSDRWNINRQKCHGQPFRSQSLVPNTEATMKETLVSKTITIDSRFFKLEVWDTGRSQTLSQSLCWVITL